MIYFRMLHRGKVNMGVIEDDGRDYSYVSVRGGGNWDTHMPRHACGGQKTISMSSLAFYLV